MGLNLFWVHSAPCLPNDLKTGTPTNLQYEIPRPWFESLELELKCFSRLTHWQTLPVLTLTSILSTPCTISQQFASFNQPKKPWLRQLWLPW